MTDRLIVPEARDTPVEDVEHQRMWGFADSAFIVRGGQLCLESTRYETGGHALPGFAPFVHKAVGVPFDPAERHEPGAVVVPAGLEASALEAALQAELGAELVTTDATIRLRHGHGHHLEEIYRLLYEQLDRIPDVVVWPTSDEQVRAVLLIAQRTQALVIPFGGGTTVSMSLSCPKRGVPIISLDLAKLNRVLWLDPGSRTACIEAGAVGRVLEQTLAEHGFTLGHEPDSIEFSTLGGWIATNASGMKKNRYGNIEEVVLDVTVVTALGIVEHPVNVPRASHGLDVRRLIFGSEGLLGVITRAVVKVHRLPDVQRYGALVFPDWSSGLACLRAMSEWQALPASVRLVDNLQFQFGQALKPPRGRFASLLQRFLLTRVKGFDLQQLVACTLVYEGEREEQRLLEKRVGRLAARYGALSAGPAAGKAGYSLTFGIAYIRDFLLPYWTIGDSFETSVQWGKVDEVIAAVKAAVVASHLSLALPGHPFVTARVSQLYQTGCCIYFYLGFYYKGVVDPLAAFREVEHRARLAILDAGGALSHHHGIGKVRAPYLDRVKSPAALAWVAQATAALDPDGIFASGNQEPPRRAAP